MHNTTPNNIYNRNRRILIISLLIGFIILVAVILIVSIYYLRRSATLDILVAPTSATITIDGQTYTNGTYKIEPTSTTATITAEGFTSQEVPLNIIGGETTTLYLYLIPTDGDMNWYLDHPDDMMIVTQIGDLQALATSDAYHTEHPISQVLPIVVVEVNPTTYDWTEFRIDGGSFAECSTDFCVKITDTTGGNYDRALEEIRSRGYDPGGYEILYEYTPVEPLP